MRRANDAYDAMRGVASGEASVPACQACGCEGGGGRHSREQRHLELTKLGIMQCVQGEVVPVQEVARLPPTMAPLVVW